MTRISDEEFREVISRAHQWSDNMTSFDVFKRFAQLVAQDCALIAAQYIINEGVLHPDISFKDTDQRAKDIAHMACQYVRDEIEERYGIAPKD